MNFPKAISDSEYTYYFPTDGASSLREGDMLLLSFTVRGGGGASLEITVDSACSISEKKGMEHTVCYCVPAQLTKISMPIKNISLKSISLKAVGRVEIIGAVCENMGNADIEELILRSGMFLLEDYERVILSPCQKIGAGKTIDMTVKNGYIYSIGAGKLTITDISTGKILSSTPTLNTLRQIAITDDGRYAVVTGRQDGVAIINIEKPESPRQAAIYNPVEFATGLYICGDYAFLCNRIYGVEIVDISNPERPVHLANIHSGEVQSCAVHGGILYAGVWGECGVYMYDLSQLCDSPFIEPAGFVKTNGKGDGLSVEEIDGKIYLFAATGHYRTDCATFDSPLSNLWHGQGNGMDIFDVTDPANPRLVSEVRIDGRFYYFANDFWETHIDKDEESGRYYAYLVNTYNGVYVYDITDVSSPERIMHIVASEPVSGDISPLTHPTRTIIIPWDQKLEKRSPIGSVAVCEGQIFIAAVDTDIYRLDVPFARGGEEKQDTVKLGISSELYSLRNLTDDEYLDNLYINHRKCGGQAYAAAVAGNTLYVAAGSGGVEIYNAAGTEKICTLADMLYSCAYDVSVFGDTLCVAWGAGGLGIYDVSDSINPSLRHRYAEGTLSVRQAVISPDGVLVIIQLDDNDVRVIDLTNPSAGPVYAHEVTNNLMYHRQISPVIGDRYVVYHGHTGIEFLLDFGNCENRNAKPTLASEPYRGCLGMTGGMCGIENIIGETLVVRCGGNNQFVLSDIMPGGREIRVDGLKRSGHPTLVGDTLAVCNRVEGTVDFYDVSDIVANRGFDIKFKGTLLCAGNPDRAYAHGNRLYVPLGYQGFIVIDV